MRWERLKFWHKRSDGSSKPPAVSIGDGAVQPSRIATPNQAPTSHAQSAILPRAPDLMADASLHALPTDAAVASPTSLTATPSTKSSSESVLERLWIKAYDSLRTDEKSTVLAYETLLVKRLEERNKGSSTQITLATLNQREQLREFVDTSFEGSKKIATAKENMQEFNRVAQPVKTVMDVVVKAAPEAALAWSCVSFALQILANPLTESTVNRDGIKKVLMTMDWYQRLVELLVDDESRTQDLRIELENHIVELYKRLLIYQMKSVCRYNRREILVILRDMVKLDNWKGKLDDVENAEKQVRSRLEQYQRQSINDSIQKLAGILTEQSNEIASAIQEQTRTQQTAHDESKRREFLRALRQTVNPQDEKERIQDEKGNLLRDCYSWILDHEKFLEWQQNKSTRILWVAGDPGKGKTMLLCGIIDELEKKPTNVLSYFFCQATQETLSNATAVLRGIIYGLAKKYPQLDRHISEKYEDGGAAAFAGETAWVVMRNILRAMLSDPYMDGVILIVDALDECEEDRQKLLGFICDSSQAADSRAKWVVSSRNWPGIGKAMGKVTKHISKLSLDLNDHVAGAVRKYIKQKVKDLATEIPFAGNQALCDQVTDCLDKNSENTFLWVALVCNALRQGNVYEERHVSGSTGILNEFPRGLENLYGRMLEHIESDTRDSDKGLCKHILAVASVMRRHVSLEELCSIMEFSTHFDGELDTLKSSVRYCGSFLNIQHGTVYFVHQSAVDFLQKEAFEEIFPRGIKATHQDVFVSSIKAMSKVLVCRDIYGLCRRHGREALGLDRDEITPPQLDPLLPIQYASFYWIDHLVEMGMPIDSRDIEVIHQFLRRRFLYWIEALALLRQLPQAIRSIQKLQKLVAGMTTPDEENLSEFLHDANRFLLYHRDMIERTPLQLYASALMFSPEQSIVRRQFWSEAPDWVTVTHGVDTKWDACLQTLFGHGDWIVTLAYSPDGQWLVSGDLGGVVKLWHVDSGTCEHTLDYNTIPVYVVKSYLQAKPPCVVSVAFSADGLTFTSEYSDGIFKVFDRVTGDCIGEITDLARPENDDLPWFRNVARTAISRDSHSAAFVLLDNSISILKLDSGAPPRTVRPHSNEVHTVALTADGHFLASTYDQGNIDIRDTSTGISTQVISTDEKGLQLIFSADGRWLATGGQSGGVRVWESTTGRLALTLRRDRDENKSPGAQSIAFSDNSRLVAASYEGDLCVWDTTTSSLTWRQDSGVYIPSLSFSPDSLRLVSGSSDRTIKIWDLPKDIDSTAEVRLAQGLRYSDGLHFAAYYPAAQEIEIWAGRTETAIEMKKFHENDVRIICLSPDHRSLASASIEGKITVWDTDSGNQKQTFGDYGGNHSIITSLVFRGNSQLASGLFGMIDIWDASDGRHRQRVEGEDGYIKHMTFSLDGQLLAYKSPDFRDKKSLVTVWDIEKEPRCQVLRADLGGIKSPTALSFSADSQLLAVASRGDIFLLDLRCGTFTWILKFGAYFGKAHVSFDANLSRRLHTRFGFLDLTDQNPNDIDSSNAEDDEVCSGDSNDDVRILSVTKGPSGDPLSFRGYGLSDDLGWVTYDERRLFEIPFDYRAGRRSEITPVIGGSTLIWISHTGRLMRMHFNH
ncbi:hypothetical protein KVR01_004752 [Diaporthe batatas]|uniref:uncharacterized protein n=1 Tax=Diaporthe batatas TaxID=748121 RepID=UPI001D03E978|nr:uncharacterized protein KVR01_004752 [Diaporthe batatas]KAG8166200.1 hypothetical protein KVR01_004752 [Diaporthe batatas]